MELNEYWRICESIHDEVAKMTMIKESSNLNMDGLERMLKNSIIQVMIRFLFKQLEKQHCQCCL